MAADSTLATGLKPGHLHLLQVLHLVWVQLKQASNVGDLATGFSRRHSEREAAIRRCRRKAMANKRDVEETADCFLFHRPAV
jgi:hypothetical protein